MSRARRCTPLRLTGLAACLLLAFSAVSCWLRGSAHDRSFERWLTETPLSLPIDLSRPGQFSAPFTQTCAIAHGQHLRLVLASPETILPASTFDQLEASLVLTDGAGHEVGRLELSPRYHESIPDPCGFEGMLLGEGIMGPNGSYTATLSVTRGVPALHGFEQRLIVRNEICGLERLPATFFRVIAAASGFVAACIAIPLLAGLLAGRRTLDPGTQPPRAT